jgi:hypothetical protein
VVPIGHTQKNFIIRNPVSKIASVRCYATRNDCNVPIREAHQTDLSVSFAEFQVSVYRFTETEGT